MLRLVVFLVSLGAWAIRALVLSRSELLFENLALRQQVCALKRERPRSPLDDVDRAFWVALRASWPGWASRLIIVDQDTPLLLGIAEAAAGQRRNLLAMPRMSSITERSLPDGTGLVFRHGGRLGYWLLFFLLTTNKSGFPQE